MLLIQAPLSRERKLSSFPIILCGVNVSFETLPVNPALCFIPRIYRRQVVPGVIQPLALRTSSNSLPRHLYHHHSLTHTFFFSMTMPLQTTFMHFLDISPTFAITLILSFLILSSLVTPLIHLNTFISATYCDFFTAHVLWFCPGSRSSIHILYYHYIIIWQSLLRIAPPDLLTMHSIVRLPCFTANIASAIPLPGIKPNCASLSLILKVSLITLTNRAYSVNNML